MRNYITMPPFVRSFQFCNDTKTFIVLSNRKAKPRVLNSLKPTDVLLRSVGSDSLFSWLARSSIVSAFNVTQNIVFLHPRNRLEKSHARRILVFLRQTKGPLV